MGRIAVSEIIMLGSIPVLIGGSGQLRFPRELWLFFYLFVLALLSVTVSDRLINNIDPHDYFRGIARYLVLAMIVLFWWLALQRGFDQFAGYLVGSVFGSVLNLFIVSEFDRESVQVGSTGYDFWLTKVSPIVDGIVMLSCFVLYRKSKLWTSFLLFAAAIFFALTAGRATAGVYLLGSIGVAIIWWHARTKMPFIVSPMQFGKLCVIILVGGLAIYGGYVVSAPRGWLGDFQKEKFERQAAGRFGVTPWGILLGGRVDFVQAAMVVGDAPIWGVGSWAIPRYYLAEAYAEVGVPMPKFIEEIAASGDSSAGHSMLMGSWATGGIFTVPLFLFGIWTVGRLLLWSLSRPSPVSPYIIVTSLAFLFSVMFNPFSLSNRNTMGLLVGAACAVGTGLPKLVRARRLPPRRRVSIPGGPKQIFRA